MLSRRCSLHIIQIMKRVLWLREVWWAGQEVYRAEGKPRKISLGASLSLSLIGVRRLYSCISSFPLRLLYCHHNLFLKWQKYLVLVYSSGWCLINWGSYLQAHYSCCWSSCQGSMWLCTWLLLSSNKHCIPEACPVNADMSAVLGANPFTVKAVRLVGGGGVYATCWVICAFTHMTW